MKTLLTSGIYTHIQNLDVTLYLRMSGTVPALECTKNDANCSSNNFLGKKIVLIPFLCNLLLVAMFLRGRLFLGGRFRYNSWLIC